jgi:uncharacterized protein
MRYLPLFFFSAVLHGLVGWLLAGDMPHPTNWGGSAVLLWCAFSALAMPLGLVQPRWIAPRARLVSTWFGLLAMGLFSSMFVLTLVREIALTVFAVAHWVGSGYAVPESVRVDSALVVGPLALLMTMAGFWNARRTAAVVRVNVPLQNLPLALEGFSIAQISDIHVGPTIKTHYLQRIVNRVNGLGADMVAITGDLVDGPVETLGVHIQPLRSLQSRYGTFFVTGNHEYYSGAHRWIDKLRAMGINVLMNEHVVIEHATDSQAGDSATVVVAGVTDFSAHQFDETHRSDPQAALVDAPVMAHVKLLLAHQPRSAPAAAQAGFDLQLSGHTHGGQFWPWGYFVKFQQPFTAGLHRLQAMWVYTSRGTGYWGPPKRFGAPSEITLLRLVRA